MLRSGARTPIAPQMTTLRPRRFARNAGGAARAANTTTSMIGPMSAGSTTTSIGGARSALLRCRGAKQHLLGPGGVVKLVGEDEGGSTQGGPEPKTPPPA